MEREILRNILKFRFSLTAADKVVDVDRSHFPKTITATSVRYNSNLPNRFTEKRIRKAEELNSGGALRVPSLGGVEVQHWNETVALRKERREVRFPNTVKHISDLIGFVQSWNNFPVTPTELKYFFKRRWMRQQLAEQKYLPQRVAVLKPDLAAAHFIARRGGHVKFLGSQEWVGYLKNRKILPMAYVPGMFVEGINAEGTNLIMEGLENFNKLRHLTFLSLRNLITMNDWCMDLISKEHCLNLKHLDISGCKNITYRGLSCFYRFECLKTLNVEGIPDTPEFKVACLMLLEIMPDLEIQGIDLSIPDKIDPVSSSQAIDQPKSEIAV